MCLLSEELVLCISIARLPYILSSLSALKWIMEWYSAGMPLPVLRERQCSALWAVQCLGTAIGMQEFDGSVEERCLVLTLHLTGETQLETLLQ